MSDQKKTKKQLVEELKLLRGRITALQSRAPQTAPETGSPAESEEKFQVIFNKSLDATLILDGKSGKILAANESTANVFGYKNDFLVGKHFSILFSPEEKKEKRKAATPVESYDSVFTQEFVRADGTVRTMDLIANLIPWGKEKRILASFRYATERKEAEARREELLKRIHSSHAHLLSIMNMLDLGIVTLDEGSRVTFLNKTAQQLTGRPKRANLGKHWAQVFPIEPAERAKLENTLEMPAKKREKLQVQVEFAKGRRHWLDLEVQDDPRDRERRILVLYDMTEVYDLRRLLERKARFHDLVGKSEVMQDVYQRIQEVSQVDWTVLIEGETGTGKELTARAIHSASHRRDKPFVAVNCAGLADSLLTSQLFGHKRGAFTGAVEDHRGVFEAAHGGTLFLDEVGDISKNLQTSLLRVLEEKQITRLGETKPRKVDVRVLAATHRDLTDEVKKGTFRPDLLYRLRIARITLPPLSERREDIPLLVESFLGQSRAATGKSVETLSDEALRTLLQYDWPGNVRELKSAVDYATLHCKGAAIVVKDLPPEVKRSDPAQPAAEEPQDERQRILAALEQAEGSRTRAARLIGMSRATFYRRLEKLKINPS